jgi:integrase
LPRSEGEKRRQRIKSGFRTRKEAEQWFSAEADRLRLGISPRDDRLTVGQYLEQWIESLEAPGSRVRAAALRSYRNKVDLHIIPALGHIRLSELNATQIDEAKRKWSATKPIYDKKTPTLSGRTVHHIYSTLNAALNRARRQQLIAVNPCSLTDAPRFERDEMLSLDASSAGSLLKVFAGTIIDAAIVTAIGTGLRRGELLALKWGDVDPAAGTLTVNRALEHENGATRFKEPKTKRSRRTISLPAFVQIRLRQHKVEQAERFLRDGLGRPTAETLLFERAGQPWVPNTFGTVFYDTLQRSGLPHIRFHDLRHSFASLALAAGVDLKTVSTALGHSTISTTADLYAHVIDSLMRDAADRIDRAIAPELRRKAN